jgi:hypothetical protein
LFLIVACVEAATSHLLMNASGADAIVPDIAQLVIAFVVERILPIVFADQFHVLAQVPPASSSRPVDRRPWSPRYAPLQTFSAPSARPRIGADGLALYLGKRHNLHASRSVVSQPVWVQVAGAHHA